VFGSVFDDPQAFNEAESGVFISQIVSGREGINLSTADALVFYNIDFSATSYWQSRARIQTKNRTKDAQIYWIFAEGGIEDKIYKAVMDKKDYTLSHFKKDFAI
jgi:SNF2 family DNA or RNA helicase